jgi:hypothetical protein
LSLIGTLAVLYELGLSLMALSFGWGSWSTTPS